MSSNGGQLSTTDSELDGLLEALRASWPTPLTLSPASLRMGSSQGVEERFLRAVFYMSDHGLLSYEALLVNDGIPTLVDAMLTARGRAAHVTQPIAG